MNTDESELDKLCKVLALTNSDKPGEALAAFQSAKRMLLRHGLSFEDVIAKHFDETGTPAHQQVAALKKQRTSLQRELDEQSRELKNHKKAMKDLLNQVWELRGGEATSTPSEEHAIETIKEIYRPNLES